MAGSQASIHEAFSLRPVETAWRLRVQPTWGGWSVADIRHTDVRRWISEVAESVGASVTIRTYGVLASILDDAVYDGRISTNPARKGKITLPRKTKRRHGYLTHDEVHRLADASGQYRLLVLVLAYTGIRWGEATALRGGGCRLHASALTHLTERRRSAR